MYCDEALDAVEAVAAGEMKPDGRLVDHYATCPNCSAALASARALEELLQHRPSPRPAAQFTTRTMARVRRARWKSDQVLDLGFNVAIAVVVLAIVAGAWMLLDRSGMAAVSSDAVDMYQVPNQKKVREVTITREVVMAKDKPITLIEKAG